jgi:hypothetical protein
MVILDNIAWAPNAGKNELGILWIGYGSSGAKATGWQYYSWKRMPFPLYRVLKGLRNSELRW